jgi:hypothetical protein
MKKLFKGVDFDISKPFDIDDLIGSTGWAILGDKDDGEYGMKNTIKKWIARK